MSGIVYDAGVLIAIDRDDESVWAAHRARLEAGVLPRTTAPVVAQVSRSTRQAVLRRFLRGCRVEPFAPEHAHPVGTLLAATGSADVVDAHVVLIAAARSSTIVTSDVDDLTRLVAQLPRPLKVRRV